MLNNIYNLYVQILLFFFLIYLICLTCVFCFIKFMFFFTINKIINIINKNIYFILKFKRVKVVYQNKNYLTRIFASSSVSGISSATKRSMSERSPSGSIGASSRTSPVLRAARDCRYGTICLGVWSHFPISSRTSAPRNAAARSASSMSGQYRFGAAGGRYVRPAGLARRPGPRVRRRSRVRRRARPRRQSRRLCGGQRPSFPPPRCP